MSIILAILSLIGALPEIIELAKQLWEKILGIRNRSLRMQHKAAFRKIIFRRKKLTKMTVSENSDLERDLLALQEKVNNTTKWERFA